ncbi:MAG: T9SS type A sorting domain-containing protein [Candidatus Kapaibacteriota bacterium]
MNPKIILNSTRTCTISPFPQDSGKFVYFAGYDADGNPCANTAFVLRVDVNTTFGYPATITSAREDAQNLDVQNLAQKATLTIFPNPAQNLVSVQDFEGSSSLTLTNVLGQTVITLWDVQMPAMLDVSTLPSGMHSLMSTKNGGVKKNLLQIVR